MHFGVVAAPGGDRLEVGDEDPRVVGVVLGRIEGTGVRIGEPTVDEAGRRAAHRRGPADERGSQRVLDKGFVQVGDDLGGSGGELVQQSEQARLDVRGRTVCRRGRHAVGEVEQVVAFVAVQSQRSGQRGEHLGRGLGAASTFQLRVVVGGQARQLRDLLASQSGDRRRGPVGRPTSDGRIRARRDFRNAASSEWFTLPIVTRTGVLSQGVATPG